MQCGGRVRGGGDPVIDGACERRRCAVSEPVNCLARGFGRGGVASEFPQKAGSWLLGPGGTSVWVHESQIPAAGRAAPGPLHVRVGEM